MAKAEEKESANYSNFQSSLVNFFRTLLSGKYLRYGLTPEQYINFLSAFRNFFNAYEKYQNPATRTPAVVITNKKTYKIVKKQWDILKQQIKNDKTIEPLTAEELIIVGIHTDKETRTPATIPADAPVIVEIGRSFHITKFQAQNRPYKSRLLVKVAYPAAGTEPTESDYQIAEETGRKNFTIIAPSKIAKGTVAYLKGFYVNNKGNGPESRPIKFVVN